MLLKSPPSLFGVSPTLSLSLSLSLNSLPDEVDLRRDFFLHDASARASWCELGAEHELSLPGLSKTSSHKVEARIFEHRYPHAHGVK